jgi:hypothetical protein
MHYEDLLDKSGEKCYTVSRDKEATMLVDEEGVTIVYESDREMPIPRSMVEAAIKVLKEKGTLTVNDVHEGITDESGPLTDRLMAVMRKFDGVEITSKHPRELRYVRNDK